MIVAAISPSIACILGESALCRGISVFNGRSCRLHLIGPGDCVNDLSESWLKNGAADLAGKMSTDFKGLYSRLLLIEAPHTLMISGRRIRCWEPV